MGSVDRECGLAATAVIRPLLLVYPDRPWLHPVYAREWIADECAPVLNRMVKIVRAAELRDIVLIPFGCPESWAEVSGVGSLLALVAARAAFIAPHAIRVDVARVAEWVRSLGIARIPPIVGGFWLQPHVEDVARQLNVVPDMSICSASPIVQ